MQLVACTRPGQGTNPSSSAESSCSRDGGTHTVGTGNRPAGLHAAATGRWRPAAAQQVQGRLTDTLSRAMQSHTSTVTAVAQALADQVRCACRSARRTTAQAEAHTRSLCGTNHLQHSALLLHSLIILVLYCTVLQHHAPHVDTTTPTT
jgi:hypothetical protein